jgi:hypothetical protein
MTSQEARRRGGGGGLALEEPLGELAHGEQRIHCRRALPLAPTTTRPPTQSRGPTTHLMAGARAAPRRSSANGDRCCCGAAVEDGDRGERLVGVALEDGEERLAGTRLGNGWN